MKKAIRVASKTLAVIIVLILTLIVVSFINHSVRLNNETKKYPSPGKIVEVNGHNMHVYTEGTGNLTLVFMSGGGTPGPAIDFKALYSILSEDYRIAVVEKAGYGWSDVANVSRNIDKILEETRKALELAGETGPYILVPHSMSGIEAIYWGQKYPNEVKAIIGLDPAVPEAYDNFPIPSTSLATLLARIGIFRFLPSICDSSAAIQNEKLTEQDVDIYRAMFYKNTLTSNMLEEIRQIKSNAVIVKENGVPVQIPMCFFASNGLEIPIENWHILLSEYINNLNYGRYVELQCGHYVHDFEPETIAMESRKFIEEIDMVN